MDHVKELAKRFVKAINYIGAEELVENDTELATALGTYQPIISQIRSGKRMPTVEMIHLVCKKFNINPAFIILGQGDIFATTKPKSPSKLQKTQ
jgi:transcriptional regulator with XRE-family HTH domain